MSAVAPVLLLAIGNESRGDDALGPLLLRRLGEIIEGNRSEFELIEEFQLQVENTLDIKGRRLVLFIDAGDKTPAPFSFYPVPIKCLDGHLTHALSPEALLGVYARVHGESPPPAFVLCVSGMSFELGEPLSTEAEENLEHAIAFARQLMARLSGQAWQDIEKGRAANGA